jgi:hypothetical protein
MAVEKTETEQGSEAQIIRFDSGARAEVDMQVSTAKSFPRSIRRVMDGAKSMVTASQEIAESCLYSYRRGGKDITGPSVRLAEIMAANWGNLRCQSRIVDEGPDFVTAQGTAWDMERNYLVQKETRRSIRGNDGRRYSADMIAVTANAASSIALRDAIFKVIPKVFTDEAYNEARAAAVGDLRSLAERRANALKTFAAMGVASDRVLARLGITDEREVTLEHLAVLTGIRTALRDGERMLEDEFPEPDDAKPKAKAEAAPAAADKLGALASQVRGRAGGNGGNGGAKPPAVTTTISKPRPAAQAPLDDVPTPDDVDDAESYQARE